MWRSRKMWWRLHADAFLLLGQDNAEKGIERDEKDKDISKSKRRIIQRKLMENRNDSKNVVLPSPSNQ